MKFTCEVCGCTLDDMSKMTEHEKQCRAAHQNLICCVDEINACLMIAANPTMGFQIVVEIPVQSTETKDKDASVKTELKHYQITAAEADAKKNRCVLKIKYDEPSPTDTKTSKRK